MDDVTATLRGLTIGAGTDYRWARWPEGLFSTPPVRAVDEPLPQRDGVIAGGDYLDARSITFELQVLGTSRADVETKLTALTAAFASSRDDLELEVRISGTPSEYAFFGRPRGALVGLDRRFVSGEVGAARCTFVATDPVRYGAEMNQVIGLLSHPLPQTLPFTLGYHDSETINNPGTATVDRWTLEFAAVAGILKDPSIAHVGLGQLIFHDLTIPSGETLLVNGQERRALLNGVTPVVPTIAEWWAIQPLNNTIRFAAGTASSLSSTATLTWRPGYS